MSSTLEAWEIRWISRTPGPFYFLKCTNINSTDTGIYFLFGHVVFSLDRYFVHIYISLTRNQEAIFVVVALDACLQLQEVQSRKGKTINKRPFYSSFPGKPLPCQNILPPLKILCILSCHRNILLSGRPSPPPGGTGGTGGTGGGSGGGGGGGGGGGSGYGGGDNWRGGHRDDSSNTKSSSAAAPAPDAARDGWMSMLGAGGIGAALGYMMRPRQPRNAPRGSNAWNQGYGTGTFGGGGYRPRSPGGGGGGGGTGMRMRAGYGGTSRR